MDNGLGRVIFTYVWVSRYETHRFPQVGGGQRDPRVLGRHKNNICIYIYIYIYIETQKPCKLHMQRKLRMGRQQLT